MADQNVADQSLPVDGFRLVYERTGSGPAVVLLHGWPGDRSDYRHVTPMLTGTASVVVPDLRGSLAERTPDPADRLAIPTTVLWPEHDPLFPRDWSDRLGLFFSDLRVHHLDGVGHFVPLEAAADLAAAVSRSL